LKVLLFNEETGTYRGAIKDAHPEDDPWRDPTAFRTGTVWDGTVTHRIMGGRGDGGLVGYMVRLKPGVSGLLMVEDVGEGLSVGDRIEVQVSEVEEGSQKIRLVRCSPRTRNE
jgi:ribosomal protein S1